MPGKWICKTDRALYMAGKGFSFAWPGLVLSGEGPCKPCRTLCWACGMNRQPCEVILQHDKSFPRRAKWLYIPGKWLWLADEWPYMANGCLNISGKWPGAPCKGLYAPCKGLYIACWTIYLACWMKSRHVEWLSKHVRWHARISDDISRLAIKKTNCSDEKASLLNDFAGVLKP
jgi:hypothetical protein